MGKFLDGKDFLYFGLGAGALYAIYKLTKPVTDATSAVSGVVQGAAGALGSGITFVQNGGAGAGVSPIVERTILNVTQPPTGYDERLKKGELTPSDMPIFAPSDPLGILRGVGAGTSNALIKIGSSLFSNKSSSAPNSYVDFGNITVVPHGSTTPLPFNTVYGSSTYSVSPDMQNAINGTPNIVKQLTSKAPATKTASVSTTLYASPSSGGAVVAKSPITPSKVIGAKVGTAFSSGAYVKSSGASGLYRKY